ncbi:MAG: hypothetical protein FWE28_08665 [Oscillospiraceae bacterium]|nr:hypothetical protein [Oscillospiraceae bacterium]
MRRWIGIVLVGLCLFLAGCTREERIDVEPEEILVTPAVIAPGEQYFDIRIFDVPHVPWREHSVAVADGRLVGFKQDMYPPIVQAYSVDIYGADLQMSEILYLEGTLHVIGPRLGRDGELWLLVEVAAPYSTPNSTLLFRLDNRGNVLEQVQIEASFTWKEDMETDAAGNLYLLGQRDDRHLVIVYNPDTMTPIGEVAHDGWDTALVRIGDHVYLGGWGQAVQRIEVGQAVTLGERTSLGIQGRTWSGLDGRVYFFNENSLYSQAPGDDIVRREFGWMGVDIPHALVQSILVLEDGTIMVSLQGDQMVVLTPTDEPSVAAAEQQTLILATVGHGGDLDAAVAQFNREQSDYRIVIDDYSRYDTMDDPAESFRRLQADLLTETGPDIVDLSGFDPALLSGQGALLDLTSWMDVDAFVPEVLAALEQDGAIYMLPATFYVMTLVGGPEHRHLQGWDMERFLDYAEGLPSGAQPISPAMTGLGLVQLLAMHNWDELTMRDDHPDWFLRLLEYAADLHMAAPPPPDEHRPLELVSIADIAMRQLYEALFDELVFVGFPGGAESVFGFGRSFGIPQGSAAPDAAWDFIRQFVESTHSWGLPVLQVGLDAKIDTALASEESETWGVGSLLIEIGPATTGDVEWLLELIANTATFAWLDGVAWAELEAQILEIWPDPYTS